MFHIWKFKDFEEPSLPNTLASTKCLYNQDTFIIKSHHIFADLGKDRKLKTSKSSNFRIEIVHGFLAPIQTLKIKHLRKCHDWI
jgi:hypothetical protein